MAISNPARLLDEIEDHLPTHLKGMLRLLVQELLHEYQRHTAVTLNLTRSNAPMSIAMIVSQEDALAIAPLGAAGEPEPVTGITWTSSAPAVATVTPAADGLSAVVVSVAPGAATVNVTAVNAAGATLSASQDYTITEPAVGLNLTAGTPTAIPTAPAVPTPIAGPGVVPSA